jgi:hypothetical protein
MFYMPDPEFGGMIILLALSFGLREMQNFSLDPAKKVSRKQTGDVCRGRLLLGILPQGGGISPTVLQMAGWQPLKGKDADSYEPPGKRYFGIEGDPPTLCGE